MCNVLAYSMGAFFHRLSLLQICFFTAADIDVAVRAADNTHVSPQTVRPIVVNAVFFSTPILLSIIQHPLSIFLRQQLYAQCMQQTIGRSRAIDENTSSCEYPWRALATHARFKFMDKCSVTCSHKLLFLK